MARALVVHGHFYQPPRENPWTEEVPRQPSAAPFHDWNERVDAESYRPNSAARIVDDRGRVLDVVNSYASLSFDAGPTLLAWLEDHDRLTYERIVDGDRRGGGAIAQAHGHLILPLCPERDVRTQVRWGLADFRHRFGREAPGIWLPETAVDDAVLGVLAEEGVGFTVLAPWQVEAVRVGDEWQEATPDAVASRVFRWLHPDGSGRSVDLVVYDGPLSHALAFEVGSMSSHALLDRVESAPGEAVVVAADGETFGHHHTFADRLLAHVVRSAAPARDIEVTTAAALVERAGDPPQARVRTSAWSCAHGVERWRSDCGCSTGGEPGWSQAWRRPLRDALDVLRAHADEVFARRGKEVLADPEAARDAYVGVLLGAVAVEDFLAEHATGDEVEALTLLESQRHAMSMYTSCGWFFNDLAGIETVQVLAYACRVADLLADLGEAPPLDEFLGVLATAASNDPERGDGRRIWDTEVVPMRVRPERVAAHVALRELLERVPPGAPVAGHHLEVVSSSRVERGPLTLATGHVAVTANRTRRRTEHQYAALHLGALEVIGVVRDAAADDGLVEHLRDSLVAGAPVTTLLRVLSDIGGREFGLAWALPGHADEILATAAANLLGVFARAHERLFDEHRPTLAVLAASGYPLPAAVRAPIEIALARRLEAEIDAQRGSVDPAAYAAALGIVAEAEAAGVRLDTPDARAAASRFLLGAVEHAAGGAADAEDAAALAVGMIDLSRRLGLEPDLERPQELVLAALRARPSPALRRLGGRLGLAVEAVAAPDEEEG